MRPFVRLERVAREQVAAHEIRAPRLTPKTISEIGDRVQAREMSLMCPVCTVTMRAASLRRLNTNASGGRKNDGRWKPDYGANRPSFAICNQTIAITPVTTGRRGSNENHIAPRSRPLATAIHANAIPTMQASGNATILAKSAMTGGLVSDPGASNIITDMSAITAPINTAGIPSAVSTMIQVRTGRRAEAERDGGMSDPRTSLIDRAV